MSSKDSDKRITIYRTPTFERCLDDLRREKGGTAAMAARKADEFMSCLMNGGDDHARKKFSFTWNGEYRIKNCKKIDLVGAYRLVLMQKDSCFILLYAGSHDDCFRWLERNKGLSYEVDFSTHAISVVRNAGGDGDILPEDVLEEKKFVEHYEQKLTEQLDDDLLARIFSGWRRTDQDGDRDIGAYHPAD